MQLCTASTLTNCCDGSQKVQKSRRVVIFGVGGGGIICTLIEIGLRLEIVMNELRKLRMSADFFANTSHDISRFPGV